MRLFAALLAAALCLSARRPTAEDGAPLVVEAESIDGARWWTVRGKDVPLDRLLLQVARKAGFRLEGLLAAQHDALVSVDLRRRPLDQVLEVVLGSLGLAHDFEADRLIVMPADAGSTSEELLDAATAAWSRAANRFPTHPRAVAARLAQGEIAELRGLLVAADDLYRSVITTFPGSSEAAEALLRSGRIHERLGEWSEASMRFRELASLPGHDEFHAPARLELARCLLELGNPESARFLLDTLDSEYPTADGVEQTERLLVRAQVPNALGRPMEALRLLDASARALDPLAGQHMLRVRAQSLEGVGMPGEAGRAWLLFADKAGAAERTRALEEAARLALVSGDELGVLFIHKEAEPEARTARMLGYWHEARQRLGLEARHSAGAADVVERIEAGEDLLESGEAQRAATLFEALLALRGTLDEEPSARITAGWARCLEARGDLEAAIDVLRRARPEYATLEARRRLDLAAAGLFEKHERFDLSVEAYRGIYPAGGAITTPESGGEER